MSNFRENECLTSAGLAEGTAANTFQISRAFDAVINGRPVRKGATDNIAFVAFAGTAFATQAAGTIAAYFVMMDGAGTVTVLQSAIRPRPGVSTYAPGVFEWPMRDNAVCIGALTVRTNAAATFTAGATDLGATDVVDVFIDALPGVTTVPVAF